MGTGKTTISRQLITRISRDPQLGYFLVLDPGFTTVVDFLGYVLTLFTGKEVDLEMGELYLKEQIKRFLFTRGVDEKKTIVLIIDEGQKLPLECLEALRELLNYETNAEKLLQMVIFAQKELDPLIEGLPNFKDRINFRYCLAPLGFIETRQMIRYRLSRSRVPGFGKSLFSFPAHVGIYLFTRGYPRKIINLCHQVVLSLLIQNCTRAGWFLVMDCGLKVFPEKKARIGIKTFFAGFVLVAFLLVYYGGEPEAVIDRAARVLEKPLLVDSRGGLPSVAPYGSPVTPKTDLSSQTDILDSPLDSFGTGGQMTKPDSVSSMPKMYGHLKAPRDVTLSSMAGTVYGRFNQQILELILSANPDIQNPNLIRSGMSIAFPVVETGCDGSATGWTRDAVCLFFSRHTDFRVAYGKARSLRLKDVDARMFPVWSPHREFVFFVILNQPFATMAEAQAFKQQMPTLANSRCTVLYLAGIGGKLP